MVSVFSLYLVGNAARCLTACGRFCCSNFFLWFQMFNIGPLVLLVKDDLIGEM